MYNLFKEKLKEFYPPRPLKKVETKGKKKLKCKLYPLSLIKIHISHLTLFLFN